MAYGNPSCFIFPCKKGDGDCPICNRPSHFNTDDGETNGIVNTIPTYQRYVASPGIFHTGGWDDHNLHPVTRQSTLIYSTPEVVFFDDLETVFIARVYDADGTTVIAENILTNISSNTTVTNQGITVQISDFGNINGDTSDARQGRIRVTFDLTQIVPNSGRVTLYMEHQTDITTTKQQELFYDSESNTATLSGVSIQENTANRIINWLSGVKFYSLNSPFIVDIADIDYLNGDSYPYIQTQVFGSLFGLPQLDLAGENGDLTGWNNAFDDIDDSYHNENWRITATDYCYSGDGSVQAHTVDWNNGSDVDSNHMFINVNTWGQESTALEEYFVDEAWRKTSTWTDWDSTQDLRTYDDNNGAQVICHHVQVPDTDYSNYYPQTNPDYSSYNGNVYRRIFVDVENKVRTTAFLSISGFTLDDLINNRIELWFFIPGKWTSECYAHTAEEYNFSTFQGDNDPIRVNDSTSDTIHISFGTLGLDENHNEIQMRMVINDANIKPSQIVVSW